MRRLPHAALVLIAASALAACGGGRDAEPTPSSVTAAASTQRALADSATWTQVAFEGQSFSVTGTQTARYGKGTTWVTQSVTGTVKCSNEFFGADPAVGTMKVCQIGGPVDTTASGATGTTTTTGSTGSTGGAGATAGTGAAGTATPADPVAAPATVSGQRSGLGINVDEPAYWNSGWPFINELKRASAWMPRCNPWLTPATCKDFAPGTSSGDTGESIAWDENGYPLRLPAANDTTVKYRMVSALLFQGDGGSHPAGRYVVRYDGQGTLTYVGSVRKVDAESRPGRDVLEVTNEPDSSLTLNITATNPADHLRNIRLIGPGGVCAGAPKVWVTDAATCAAGSYRSLEDLSATQTFHPAFVGDLTGFRVLRLMNWSAANTSRVVSWSQRPRTGDAMWTRSGVPYEAMFELAATTGTDPWVNVPTAVDDDFARQLAQLAKRSLAPGATMYFEYGNEPWNQAPPYSDAGVLFAQKAAAKWPGATLPDWQQRLNWYAYRAVQLCRIVKQEFGSDAARVRCVANSQAANSAVSQTIMSCELAKAELGAPCGRLFDAMAIAPYFGYYIGANEFAATVDAWTSEPDGGLDKVFREITGRDAQGNPVTPPLYTKGGWTPPDGSLPDVKRWIAGSKKVADTYGIPLIAYESGQHLFTYRGGKTEAMLRAANRDPRMAAAMKQLVDDWKANGGQLFSVFSYVQRAERGGAWGSKEYQRDDNAVKWRAVKDLRDAPCWWSGCTP